MFSSNTSAVSGSTADYTSVISGMVRMGTDPYTSSHFITLNAFGFLSGPQINGSDYVLLTGQADSNDPFDKGLVYKTASEYFYLNKGYWGPGVAINLITGASTVSPSLPNGNHWWRSGPTTIESVGWSGTAYTCTNPTWATITSLSWVTSSAVEGYANGHGTLNNGYSFAFGGANTFEYPAGTFYYGYTRSQGKSTPTGSYMNFSSFTGTTGSTTGMGLPGNNGNTFYHWNTNNNLYTTTTGSMTNQGSVTNFNNNSYNKTNFRPAWDFKNNRFLQTAGSSLRASTDGKVWSQIATYSSISGTGTSMIVRPLSDGTMLWFGYSASTLYIYHCSTTFTVLGQKTISLGSTAINQYNWAIGQPACEDYNAYNWTA
jgi:hypothetical protein